MKKKKKKWQKNRPMRCPKKNMRKWRATRGSEPGTWWRWCPSLSEWASCRITWWAAPQNWWPRSSTTATWSASPTAVFQPTTSPPALPLRTRPSKDQAARLLKRKQILQESLWQEIITKIKRKKKRNVFQILVIFSEHLVRFPRVCDGLRKWCRDLSVSFRCNSATNDEGTPYCNWNYNGQGIEYQLLAGPSFIFAFSVGGIVIGALADRFNRCETCPPNKSVQERFKRFKRWCGQLMHDARVSACLIVMMELNRSIRLAEQVYCFKDHHLHGLHRPVQHQHHSHGHVGIRLGAGRLPLPGCIRVSILKPKKTLGSKSINQSMGCRYREAACKPISAGLVVSVFPKVDIDHSWLSMVLTRLTCVCTVHARSRPGTGQLGHLLRLRRVVPRREVHPTVGHPRAGQFSIRFQQFPGNPVRVSSWIISTPII